MRILSLKSLLLAGFSLVALPALATPVGMAAHVAGNVQLEHGGKKSPLKLLQRVEEGDVVRCGPGAQAVLVIFNGGARFQVGAKQSATVRATGIDGATKLAALSGPSANVVKLLGGSRVGAVMARPARSFERMTPQFTGWLSSTTPHLEWLPIPGAVTYTMTLFDSYDNVVWSTSTTATSADYPADAPVLLEKRAYFWRLSGFGASGKPLQISRSGLVTFLGAEDATALTELVKGLEEQSKTNQDLTALLLVAEAYRSYGVLGQALEILEGERLRTKPGVADARKDMISSLSPFARSLVTKANTTQN